MLCRKRKKVDMLSLANVLEKIHKPWDLSKPKDDVRLVVVRMPDGSLLYVRDVDVQTHGKTGEPSIVLDVRETV